MARVSLVITARDQTARAFRQINDRASRLGRSFIVPGGESLGEKIMKGLRNVGTRIRSAFSGGLSGVASRVRGVFTTGLRALPATIRRHFVSGMRGVAGVVGRTVASGLRMGFRAVSGVVGGLFSAVRSVVTRIATMVRSMIGAGFITTMKAIFKALGPVLIGILVPAAILALSMVGAALAGALVLAFGAGFVGIAGFIASKAPAVKSAWSRMVDDVKSAWAGAGKAMEPVIIHGIGLLQQLSDAFLPHFKEEMRGASGPVQDFLDHFAQSLKDFGKRAFKPMMEGFDAFLLALGPEWDDMMKGMGDSFGALGRTVSAHSGEIAMAFTGIIGLITTMVDIINFFANAWAISLRIITAGFGYLIRYGVSPLFDAIMFLATSAVDGFAKAFGWIPGIGGKLKNAAKDFNDWAVGVGNKLDGMADRAINWGSNMDKANKKRKLEVDIGRWTKDLQAARDDLKATMSAKAVKKLEMQISEWQAKLATARQDLKTTTGVKAKAKLEGTISDLEAKIKRAKQLLADQSRRKSQSAIRGDITQLQRKIAQAKRELASVQGKTVAINIVTTHTDRGTVSHEGGRYAHGGIVGMAAGGLSRASRATRDVMVGEAGPELVRLPPGSHVRTSGATRRMMQGQGGGDMGVIRLESGGGKAADLVLELLREAVKPRGGDVQLAVMGKRGRTT